MTRSKTSIYVDKDVWRRFRRYVTNRGLEVSKTLESIMEEEMVDEMVDRMLSEMAGSEGYEIDFSPIEPKEASVSELVRTMRDERTNSLLGQ